MEVKQKYQRPQSEAVCSNPGCKKTFLKANSEINRNAKLGRLNYCSSKCGGIVNSKHLRGNIDHLKGYEDNRGDKYTVIREHLNRVKNRKKSYNITLDDLLEQWEKQNGICPYTGIKLIAPRKSKNYSLMYKASLDRVDSDKGYDVGNIQFISASANHAKNKMSHEDMIEFCKIIANKWK